MRLALVGAWGGYFREGAGGRQGWWWASAGAGSSRCYPDPKAGMGSILENQATGLAQASQVVFKTG